MTAGPVSTRILTYYVSIILYGLGTRQPFDLFFSLSLRHFRPPRSSVLTALLRAVGPKRLRAPESLRTIICASIVHPILPRLALVRPCPLFLEHSTVFRVFAYYVALRSEIDRPFGVRRTPRRPDPIPRVSVFEIPLRARFSPRSAHRRRPRRRWRPPSRSRHPRRPPSYSHGLRRARWSCPREPSARPRRWRH